VVGVSHIILHLGLCSAIAKTGPDTSIPIRVQLTDRSGRTPFTKTLNVDRDDDPSVVAELDVPWGIYRLDVSSPKYGCAASDYVIFIANHNRSIDENLTSGAPAQTKPLLLSGTAPQSFLYVQPTFVLFDKSTVACNKPVPQPIDSHFTYENDQDAYYVWLYADPSVAIGSQQLALQLRTPTHQYHYVRIPIPFPEPWTGWPQSITFNVTEDMVDGLAGQPTNTLLCPKLWETSAG
jgi:hypothetical protein